jgi:hypothetical protein
MQTEHYLSFLIKKKESGIHIVKMLQILSNSSSKFQSSVTISHYKNARIHNTPKVDDLKVT